MTGMIQRDVGTQFLSWDRLPACQIVYRRVSVRGVWRPFPGDLSANPATKHLPKDESVRHEDDRVRILVDVTSRLP
jgi:hypothetical protein